MRLNPESANCYILATNKFFELKASAQRHSILAKLTGQSARLAVFPENVRRDYPNRKLTDVIDIRIDQIVGTVSRDNDFDGKFRPLGRYLLERWVNVFVNLCPDNWSPILAHKFGEQYYVEDGHHRVSVARALGMLYIQARVWEYGEQEKKTTKARLSQCPQRKLTEACAAR